MSPSATAARAAGDPGSRLPADGRPPGWRWTSYLIEFYDELVFTVLVVALPFIRDELGLDYAQIGLLLGVPVLASSVAEPVLLLLGDTRLRRRLILIGGIGVALTLFLTAAAQGLPLLLAAQVLAYPSSGLFVSLTEAQLIERSPAQESQTMARWTAAGTVGDLLGPAALALVVSLGGSWRTGLAALGAAGLALVLAAARQPRRKDSDQPTARALARQVTANLRSLRGSRRRLLLWLALLPLADLLLDVFFGYLALFLTDVAGLAPAAAALGTTLWLAGFLAGQLALPRMLDRVDGRALLRWSAAACVVGYPAWLLIAWPTGLRLALLPLLGLLVASWYPVLKGEAYAAAPGLPSTVGALSSLVGNVGGLLAAVVGLLAARFSLTAALALLTVGPICLILLTPPTADRS